MIQAPIATGFIEEAVADFRLCLIAYLTHKGFYELWNDVRTGEPKGSGDFRGEVGVLYDASIMLRNGQRNNKREDR